jgi:two-component system, NarL family, nitrate/nitrite response regulator NarL
VIRDVDERDDRVVTVAVALRSELKRYGVERMLASPEFHDQIALCTSTRTLAEVDGPDDLDVIVAELADIIDPAAQELVGMARKRGARILALLDVGDEEIVATCAHAQADGFAYGAELDTRSLCQALIRISQGEMTMPSGLIRELLARVRDQAQQAGEASRIRLTITAREQQVLALLANGLSNKQIARSLDTSEHNVKRLVANILAKLNCPNRTLAVATALQHGYVEAAARSLAV